MSCRARGDRASAASRALGRGDEQWGPERALDACRVREVRRRFVRHAEQRGELAQEAIDRADAAATDGRVCDPTAERQELPVQDTCLHDAADRGGGGARERHPDQPEGVARAGVEVVRRQQREVLARFFELADARARAGGDDVNTA